MFRAIVYYAIYALVIIALATAIILALRPKANAPGTTGKGTIGTISETTGELTLGTGTGSLQTNTVNPNQSSTTGTSAAQPATASGTRTNSTSTTTIASPAPTPEPTPTPKAPTTPAVTPPTTQLTDTGPGSMVALFAVTSIAGSAIAYGYQRQRMRATS